MDGSESIDNRGDTLRVTLCQAKLCSSHNLQRPVDEWNTSKSNEFPEEISSVSELEAEFTASLQFHSIGYLLNFFRAKGLGLLSSNRFNSCLVSN